MLKGLWRRYRWYLIVSLLVYAAVSLWLYLATSTSETAPFQYQVF